MSRFIFFRAVGVGYYHACRNGFIVFIIVRVYVEYVIFITGNQVLRENNFVQVKDVFTAYGYVYAVTFYVRFTGIIGCDVFNLPRSCSFRLKLSVPDSNNIDCITCNDIYARIYFSVAAIYVVTVDEDVFAAKAFL